MSDAFADRPRAAPAPGRGLPRADVRRTTARRVAARLADTARYYGRGLLRGLTQNPVPLWAQAIAFKIFVTLLPLILLATGVFGLVLRQADPFATVAGFLRTFLPPDQGEQVVALVFQLQASSGALTAVGVGALLVAVLTLFTTLRYVISAAVGGPGFVPRPVLKGYAFDARMVVQAGTLAVLSVGLTLGVTTLLAEGGALAVRLGVDPRTADAAGRLTVRLLTLLVPYLLTLGMLVQLYRFVPLPRPPLASAAVGGGVAAVLLELAKNGFAVYARTLGNFSQYDAAGEGLGGLGGVFGLLLAFVFWVYLSGLILIIGAVVTGLHEARHHPTRASRRGSGVRARLAALVRRRARPGASGRGEIPEPPPPGPPDGTDGPSR